MAEPVYSERYVAFIDILGFSDIVRQSKASPDKAIQLITILEEIAGAQRFGTELEIPSDDFKAQSFSDCIVLSENASPKGLFHFLASVTLLNFELLAKGVFTRGGIAKGDLHHSDKVVFGPAMLEAYRLESSISRYPRILVDRLTHADYRDSSFQDLGSEYQKCPTLRFDDDGPPFVDILVLLRSPTADGYSDEINKCKEAIQHALNESVYDPKHFEKLRWLAIYWNGLASELGAFPVEFPQVQEFNSKSTNQKGP